MASAFKHFDTAEETIAQTPNYYFDVISHRKRSAAQMRRFIGRLVFENTAHFFIGVAGTVLSVIFIGRPETELSGGSGLSTAQPFTNSPISDAMGWIMLAVSLALLAIAVSRSR